MSDDDEQPAVPTGDGAGLIDFAELLFVLVAVAGVALVHVPAALIVGGVLGVLACERASTRRAARAAAAKAQPGEEQL